MTTTANVNSRPANQQNVPQQVDQTANPLYEQIENVVRGALRDIPPSQKVNLLVRSAEGHLQMDAPYVSIQSITDDSQRPPQTVVLLPPAFNPKPRSSHSELGDDIKSSEDADSNASAAVTSSLINQTINQIYHDSSGNFYRIMGSLPRPEAYRQKLEVAAQQIADLTMKLKGKWGILKYALQKFLTPQQFERCVKIQNRYDSTITVDAQTIRKEVTLLLQAAEIGVHISFDHFKWLDTACQSLSLVLNTLDEDFFQPLISSKLTSEPLFQGVIDEYLSLLEQFNATVTTNNSWEVFRQTIFFHSTMYSFGQRIVAHIPDGDMERLKDFFILTKTSIYRKMNIPADLLAWLKAPKRAEKGPADTMSDAVLEEMNKRAVQRAGGVRPGFLQPFYEIPQRESLCARMHRLVSRNIFRIAATAVCCIGYVWTLTHLISPRRPAATT
ncbi:MAG: hypothetical protein WCF19_04160 [Chlamydiales bacterium]